MTNYAPTIVYHDLHLTLIFFSRQKRLISYLFSFNLHLIKISFQLFQFYFHTVILSILFIFLYTYTFFKTPLKFTTMVSEDRRD